MTARASWHEQTGGPWSRITAPDIVSLLDAGCDTNPGAPALLFDDGLQIGRAAFRDRTERLAGYLGRFVGPGDRVAVMLGNRVEYLTSCLAAVAKHCVVVSVNPSLGEHDLGHILRDAAPVVLITDDRGAEAVANCARAGVPSPQLLVADAHEPDGLAQYDDGTRMPLADAGCEPDDPVAIYYTSGTSGTPKGCLFGHEYWLRYIDVYQRVFGVRADDRVLYPVPLFYEDALWHFLMALDAGTTMVALRRFSASRFWETVRVCGVTQLYSGGAIPTMLLKQPPRADDREHGLRFVVQCDVPVDLHRELVERWGVPWRELYGLTEVGIASVMPAEHAERMVGSGSIGLPCPEVTIRVVDKGGEDVPAAGDGEIVIATDTPGMMRGYYNRPEATAEMVRDGWVHTGDRGRFDEDGFLYFLGRSKDIIRRSAENVAASEVEQVLCTHPQIIEAAVMAVPDEIRGEEVMAHIRLVPGVDAEQLPPSEVVEFCARRLARFKVPRYVVYRGAPFPLGPTLRIRKNELETDLDALGDEAFDRDRALGW